MNSGVNTRSRHYYLFSKNIDEKYHDYTVSFLREFSEDDKSKCECTSIIGFLCILNLILNLPSPILLDSDILINSSLFSTTKEFPPALSGNTRIVKSIKDLIPGLKVYQVFPLPSSLSLLSFIIMLNEKWRLDISNT